MMSTPTLILTPRQTRDAQLLWQAAINLGWRVERVHGWKVPDELKSIEEPVLYLEGLMAPILCKEFGVELPEPPMDWLPKLPSEYRNREVRLATLGEARELHEHAFVKPPNEKSFPAAVYKPGDLPKEFPDQMNVLIAEPVVWEIEFRCFILDRTVQTFSVYLREGILQKEMGFPHNPEEAVAVQDFASKVLNDPRVTLGRTAVLDLGIIRDRGWAVVEQNATWGSGIYGCEPERVLNVLRYAMHKG